MRGTHTPGTYRKLFFLSCFILFLVVSSADAQNASCLKPYLWKNRVLLIFSPDLKDNQYNQQVSHFDTHLPGIIDRDLVEFNIFKNYLIHPQGNQGGVELVEKLRAYYAVDPSDFALILVGKDGSEKLRAESKLEAQQLFELIDATPMRQQELNERRQ